MKTLANELGRIREEFLTPYADCDSIVNDFCEDMLNKKSLMMLDTYVFLSEVIKEGEYLSLDFGGSQWHESDRDWQNRLRRMHGVCRKDQ